METLTKVCSSPQTFLQAPLHVHTNTIENFASDKVSQKFTYFKFVEDKDLNSFDLGGFKSKSD